jgi:NAD(P)-dependent dehydrogenase (short-subunit alcohol dehydrogenase family)
VVSLVASELFSLDGRTVVLTGASGFLGRTFARALLENGARVLALGRSARLAQLGTAWSNEFGMERVRIEQVDMYDTDALETLLHKIQAEERVDVLVNNAFDLSSTTGFNVASGSLDASSYDQWFRSFSCLYWAVLATQRLGGSMKERGGGSIVNIATMYATVAPRPDLYEGTSYLNPPTYSASKAALLAFTRYTASFWGAAGVRCNAILPGPFSNTEERSANSVDDHDPFLERLRGKTALGRTGSPRELIGALLFLASDASSYVTGHGLVVDGGWTAT